MDLKINGISYDQKLVLQKGYIQGDCEPGNRGCLSSGKEVNAIGVGTIRVARENLLPLVARGLGATTNGGVFSEATIIVSNSEYDLDVMFVNDTPVIKPEISLQMAPELAGGWVEQIGGQNAIYKNSAMLAARFYDGFHKHASDVNKTTYNSGSDKFRDKLLAAKVKLNKGDLAHQIRVFPENMSRILVTPDAEADFMGADGVILGGSNYAQDMFANGTLNADAVRNYEGDGYFGKFSGLPANIYSEDKVLYADECLGFPHGTIESVVLCCFANALGNLYGFEDAGFRINEYNLGPGIIMIPRYRFGAAVIAPKANSWVVKNGYVNPYDLFDISAVKSALGATFAPKVIPAGSRKQDITGVITSPAATGASVAVTYKKYSDKTVQTLNFTGHVVWYATTTVPTTLGEFITGYKAASKAGVVTCTNGAATITGSSISGKFVAVAVDADGTVSDIFVSETIA